MCLGLGGLVAARAVAVAVATVALVGTVGMAEVAMGGRALGAPLISGTWPSFRQSCAAD